MKTFFSYIRKRWSLASIVMMYAAAYAEPAKQDSLRTLRTEQLTTFLSTHPGVSHTIDEVTGAPHQLFGDLSEGITQTDPVEAAYQFFEQNKELYGMTKPRTELRVKGQNDYGPKQGGGTTVFFEQIYKGVKVTRGHLNVSINSSGKIYGVVGLFSPDINLSTTTSLDSIAAINLARKDLGLPLDNKSGAMAILGEEGNPSAMLVVLPYRGKYYLAYLVKVWGGSDNSPWIYFIDARSGEVLYKYDDSWEN